MGLDTDWAVFVDLLASGLTTPPNAEFDVLRSLYVGAVSTMQWHCAPSSLPEQLVKSRVCPSSHMKPSTLDPFVL